MKITIVWYNWRDARVGEQTCDSAVAAFAELQRVDLNAHAFPEGTRDGLYDWRRGDSHTLDGFVAKMDRIAAQNEVLHA